MQNTIVKNLFAGLLLCLPFFAAAQNPLLGDWVIQYPDGSGGNIPVKFTVKDDGTYTFDAGVDGVSDIEGKYILEADQITFEDTAGPYACTGKKGVYKFEVKDDVNTLTRVSDLCEVRGGAPEAKLVFNRMK